MSHYNLGSELSETAHWDEAAVSFTEGIRLDPRLLEAYPGLSLAENRSGRLDKADSVARAGLLLFPGDIRNSALFLARGTALERRGKPRDAEAAYGDALALDPDNREALFNLGRLLAAREPYGEAIPRLERLGSLEPGDAEAAVNLGVAYLHSGRPGDAEDAFRRAIGADPGLFEAYANLALIHENAGDDEQAAAVLEQYVSRNPGAAPEILFMIRQLRARAGGTRP